MTEKTNSILDLKSVLYTKVQTTEDVQNIRKSLEKCNRKNLESWRDDNGYDILHHAIMVNNIEAIGIIFAHGIFKPPHEPHCHSYIHLAANFGNKAIVAMLLQERPRDYSNTKSKFKWVRDPTEVAVASKSVSPLDVAGDSGHVGCVYTILDFYSARNRVERGSDNYLCLSCASNSPSALRLLLKQRTSEENVKAAVGAALKLANAECLDILLKCNPNLTHLFSGMNLYHVLFSYSQSSKRGWYESLLKVTSVLLKHRQNPACAIPFRTYPLYSLLSHSAADFGMVSPYIVACIVLLLTAGVDPNFDEISFEAQNESIQIKTAFGRSAYPSALHCLYDNVGTSVAYFQDDAVSWRRHVTKVTETLLRHNADPNIAGALGDDGRHGNALHAYLRILLKLGIDERSMKMFHFLVQNGANPNACVDGKYPINILMDDILLKADVFENVHKSGEEAFTSNIRDIVTGLLYNMGQTSIAEAATVECEGKPTSDLQRKVFKMARSELSKRTAMLPSLKELSRLAILQCCNMRSTDVVKLPIPTSLKGFINNTDSK